MRRLFGLLLSLLLFVSTAWGQSTPVKLTGNVPVYNPTTLKYAVLTKKRNLITGTKWFWVTASSAGEVLPDAYRYGSIYSDSSLAAGNIPAGFSQIDFCGLAASWGAIHTELTDTDSTRFRISVSGNAGQIVQFKKGTGSWRDATIGNNSIEFIGPSDGTCQGFYFRIKGCSTETWGCYLAFSGSSPPLPPAESDVFAYTLETTDNTLNINQFGERSLPSNHKFVLGVGAPGYTNWAGSGLLKLLKIGVNNYANTGAYTKVEAPNDRQYYFVPMTQTIREVAAELTPTYPDAANVSTSNFHLVSSATRLAIGQHCYYKHSTAWDWETGSYGRDRAGAYYLLDEEQFGGPGLVEFLGEVLEGWRIGQPESTLMLYGQAVNGFYIYNNLLHYPHGYSAGQILGFRDGLRQTMQSYSNAKATLDVSGGYFRVPVIKSTIYQKSGGEYILDGSGRRQLRTDEFTETIFGRSFKMHNQPTPEMVLYSQASIPDPPNYKTDVQWMLQEIYLYADYLNLSALGLAKKEYSNYDISRWKDYQLKRGVTLRPITEAWTWGGNSHRYREIGEYGLLYQTLYAYFSGVHSVESWDIGWAGQALAHPTAEKFQIKPEGTPLYPTYTNFDGEDYWNWDPSYPGWPQPGNDNFSRYTVLIGAANSFAKICQDNGYVFNSSLRYLRFNTPVYTFRNKEILATGIYQGNKFSCVFMYPYNDETDILPVKINFGGTEINFQLQGRKPVVLTWTVPTGIEPGNVIMEYDNIDGVRRKMNALVTGDPEEHYVD